MKKQHIIGIVDERDQKESKAVFGIFKSPTKR